MRELAKLKEYFNLCITAWGPILAENYPEAYRFYRLPRQSKAGK